MFSLICHAQSEDQVGASAWDVTVPDILALSHVQASAGRAGVVAEQSEATKITKYATIAITHKFIHRVLRHWGCEENRRESLSLNWDVALVR